MKYNVTFKTTGGIKTLLLVNEEITVEKLIKKYLMRVNRFYLFGSNKIYFLYNACKISFHEKKKIKEFFSTTNSPTVIINDIDSLIGA